MAPAAARRLHGVDPDCRDSDAWFAYTGETAAPHPVTSRADILLEEPLYEEDLRPVCSPGPARRARIRRRWPEGALARMYRKRPLD